MKRYGRELSVAIAIVALNIVLAFIAPGYFTRANFIDVFLSNLPVLIIAVGMTFVIIAAQIDISVGSMFAVCGITAGVMAKTGMPVVLAGLCASGAGALLGAVNGALVAYVRVPSIVVTLAAMVALRDALRWITEGAWVQDLPAGFQWLGLSQSGYPAFAVAMAALVALAAAWALRQLAAGRTIYATGSNSEAGRLAGIDVSLVTFSVFTLLGALTGLAAVLNTVRFNQIPTNAGIGLEMKVIASVVVGGTAITGGRGTVLGTVLGVVLLGTIGPALTFLGVSAYWERAVQGAIILAAVIIDAARGQSHPHGIQLAATHA